MESPFIDHQFALQETEGWVIGQSSRNSEKLFVND
jgi:hypothetical protein